METTQKMMRLDGIKVSGTRLPVESVVRLSGLKVGDKINDLIVNTACHKITATGLVKSVDYFYDVFPNKPGVVLNLSLMDEGDLLPAKIQPDAEDGPIWSALQARDPIFSRELPRTEKALNFYAKTIEEILEQQGRNDNYAEAIVLNDGNGNPAGIAFTIRKYQNVSAPTDKPNE